MPPIQSRIPGRRAQSLLVFCVLLASSNVSLEAADLPVSSLVLDISTPSVAPGAVAQVRITLATPHQISSGSIVMDFDPAVFGPVIAVDVFSAAGDQYGVANIKGPHVDAQFNSDSGGIGRLPGVPLLTITIPVLASAKSAVAAISMVAGSTPWRDVEGNRYVPVAETAQFKTGGGPSIDSVTPGGGILPAATRVRLAGRGFTPSTAIQIEGVVVDATSFVGPQAIDFIV